MARLISTFASVKLGIRIDTKLADGSIDSKTFFENDVVEGLRFVENKEVKTVTGKLDNIGFRFKKASYKNESASSLRSKLANEIDIYGLEIDSSKEYDSVITNVNAKEIVEFEGVTDVVKVDVVPEIASALKLTYSDGTSKELDLTIGTDFNDLVYMRGLNEVKISGRLKVVQCILSPDNKLTVTNIMVVSDNKVHEIPMFAIKEIGAISQIMGSDEKISDVITSISTEELAVVTVPAGEFVDALTFSSDVIIKGSNAGISAASGTRRTQEIAANETVISGKISVADGKVMELDGVTLTGEAAMSVVKSENVTLNNCKFVDVIPTDKKSYLIKGEKQDAPSKLVIENCYFGNNVVTDGMAYYNLFEINTTLADGSRIANNYFAKECCNHNLINVYNVAEGATVEIENNHFEYSGNAIRVGIIGEPECTINVKNNSYDETDTSNNGEYAGLLLVQSYGKATTSWNNCKINIEGTKHSDDLQLWYAYTGGSDTPINETNCPTVTIDGEVVMKAEPVEEVSKETVTE